MHYTLPSLPPRVCVVELWCDQHERFEMVGRRFSSMRSAHGWAVANLRRGGNTLVGTGFVQIKRFSWSPRSAS